MPGQNGTRQRLKEYGDQLVCVRCRLDKTRLKRNKTIELIIAEQDRGPGVTIPADRRVAAGQQKQDIMKLNSANK